MSDLRVTGAGAVGVGKNVYGDITTHTHVYGASSIPVELALQDPLALYADVEIGQPWFVTRQWLCNRVDAFLDTHACGFLWLEAEAGLGKSAFAAHLARSRGYLSHFTRLPAGTDAQAALRSLSAQLALRYDLVGLFPGGTVAAWAGQPEGFAALLTRAADVARARAERLVIVVDGLDEVATDSSALPLGLPSLLPAGVFVIGTHRTGRPPGHTQSPTAVVRLRADDPRHLDDIMAHLRIVLGTSPFTDLLGSAARSAADVAADLVERCGGVWVYLRYVLGEIRWGLRSVDDHATLPPNLAAYYTRHVVQWRERPDWDDAVEPLLMLLAVAREPLTGEALAALSGVTESAVRRLAGRELRPFLSVTPQGRRYQLYHASLREYLRGATGQPDRVPEDDASEAVSEALGAAARQAELRLVDCCLDSFGGLAEHLPGLAADPLLASAHDGYALRHLADHLACADPARLALLLRAEYRTPDGQSRNVWFAAHEAAGSVDAFLEDARRDRDVAAEGPTAEGELRYALLTAQVADRGGALSPVLVGRLLATGTWTPVQAVAHARRLVDPARRCRALRDVLPLCDDALKGQIVIEAERAARAVDGMAERVSVQAEVLPDVSPDRRRALADHMLTDTADGNPAWLRHVVDQLDGTHLVLAAALALHTPKYTGDSPVAYADLLRTAEASPLRRKMVERAFRIDDAGIRRASVASLAPLLDEGQRARALTDARVDLSHVAVQLLTGGAGSWEGEQLDQAIEHAFALDSWKRLTVLNALLPRLEAAERARATAEMVGVLELAPHDGFSDVTFDALAELLDADQRRRIVEGAAARASSSVRAVCRAVLLPHGDPAQRAEWKAEALDAVTETTRSAAAEPRAVHARHLGQALGLLLPALDERDVELLVAAAHDCGVEEYTAEVLAGLAPRLDSGQWAAAEARAAALAPGPRLTALLGLAASRDGEERERSLRSARTSAFELTDRRSRCTAVGELAAQPAPDHLSDLMDRVCSVVDDGERHTMLSLLAPHLDQPQLRRLVQRALSSPFELQWLTPDDQASEALRAVEEVVGWEAALPSLSFEPQMTERLIALAPYFDESGLRRALDLAWYIHDRRARARALAAFAPVLGPRPCAAVMARALDPTHPMPLQDAISMATAFVPRMDPEQRRPVLAHLGLRARQLPAPADRAVALSALAALPDDDRSQTVADAVDALLACAEADDTSCWPAALGDLAPHLARAQIVRLLDRGLELSDAVRRTAVVDALVPYIEAPLLARCLHAARPAGGLARYASALAALALELGASVSEEILREVTAVDPSVYRSSPVTELLPRLDETQQTRIVEPLLAREPLDSRVRILVPLLPSLRGTARSLVLDTVLAAEDPYVLGDVIAALDRVALDDRRRSQAFEATMTLPEYGQASALLALVDQLDQGQLATARAWAATAAVHDDETWALLLVRLAARLPRADEPLRRQAADAVLSLRGEPEAALLNALASSFTDEDYTMLLERLEVIGPQRGGSTSPTSRTGPPHWRWSWLRWLVERVPAAERMTAVARAQAAVLACDDRAERLGGIVELAAMAGAAAEHAGLGAGALAAVEFLEGPADRVAAYTTLATRLDGPLRRDAVERALTPAPAGPGRTATDIARAQIALAPLLTGEQLTTLLDRALNWPDEHERAYLLGSWAVHLGKEHRARVIADTTRFEHLESAVRVIRALAPTDDAERAELLPWVRRQPSGPKRTEALLALVPGLDAAEAMTLVREERDLLVVSAVLGRSVPTGAEPEPSDLALALRGAFEGRTAPECHRVVRHAAPLIRQVCGEDVTARSIAAVIDTARWWS
ncbi:hypothetical protein ACFV0B_16740 [Streptomyces xanthophaeus]|uniref:hypothetical protein n=2 Tax=Streptomyces xanthophaeus TaxID=67385 RepID=UPI0036BE1B21